MRRLVLPLLASLLVLSPLARAEVVDNLYQVREPVTSQQPDERNAALKRALQVLAGRLTGNPQAGQTPALEAHSRLASRIPCIALGLGPETQR